MYISVYRKLLSTCNLYSQQILKNLKDEFLQIFIKSHTVCAEIISNASSISLKIVWLSVSNNSIHNALAEEILSSSDFAAENIFTNGSKPFLLPIWKSKCQLCFHNQRTETSNLIYCIHFWQNKKKHVPQIAKLMTLKKNVLNFFFVFDFVISHFLQG